MYNVCGLTLSAEAIQVTGALVSVYDLMAPYECIASTVSNNDGNARALESIRK